MVLLVVTITVVLEGLQNVLRQPGSGGNGRSTGYTRGAKW